MVFVLLYVIDIREQRGKRREGLSQLTFTMNKGRQAEREKRKNSLELLWYKISAQGNGKSPEKQSFLAKQDKVPPSLWPDSACRGDMPLGACEDPSVRASASDFRASGLPTFSSAFKPSQRTSALPYISNHTYLDSKERPAVIEAAQSGREGMEGIAFLRHLSIFSPWTTHSL